MYNLVVSDLNGTLLDKDHMINDYTINIIRKLYNKNINIVFASGRSYDDMMRIVDKIGFNIPLICSNGAVIINHDGTVIDVYHLDKQISNGLIDLDYKSISEDILINIITEDKWHLLESIDDDHLLNEWSTVGYEYQISKKEDIEFDKITKIYYLGHNSDLLQLEKIIKNKYGDSVNMAFTLPNCLEIFSKDCTKANALCKLSEIKGYNLEKAVAFGDGFNDLEMLNEVKKGFVMNNAPDLLKEKLNHLEIIGNNYDNAVANKLIELFDLEV